MLSKLQKRNSEGFTIIEVMIVLAIAALILLIVLLAVPALQRNSRNTQRKNDVQATLGAINTYTNNNDGAVPTSLAQIQSEVKTSFYQSSDIVFNQGAPSTVNVAIGTVDASKMYVEIGAKCNTTNDNIGGAGATSRNVAIVYSIETSGGSPAKCVSG